MLTCDVDVFCPMHEELMMMFDVCCCRYQELAQELLLKGKKANINEDGRGASSVPHVSCDVTCDVWHVTCDV
jgi:hypothetical protein